MTKSETLKRYLLLIISLFFSAIGVAITKHGELGILPISSVANIMSYKIPALSLGTWLIIWNGVLILAQVLILCRNFRLIELLQIPVSLLFGWFTDFGTLCVSIIPTDMYTVRLAMVILGTVVLGFGISLSVIANVVMNPGEALVRTISNATNKNFGNVKIVFDISCVFISVILSLLFFNFKIVGTREGTFIPAMLTGMAVKFFTKCFGSPLTTMLTKKEKSTE